MMLDRDLARRRLERWIGLGARARQLRVYVFGIATVVLYFLLLQPFVALAGGPAALTMFLAMLGLAAVCVYRLGVWHGRNGVLAAVEELELLDLGEDEETEGA